MDESTQGNSSCSVLMYFICLFQTICMFETWPIIQGKCHLALLVIVSYISSPVFVLLPKFLASSLCKYYESDYLETNSDNETQN